MTQHHTPGPWTVSEPTGAYIQSAAGGIAALTYGAKEADARLIAAAPDMLAALKYCAQFIADEAENRGAVGSEMTDYEDEAVQALLCVEAAITKATGA